MWGRQSKHEWGFWLLPLWSEISADLRTTLLSRSIELLVPCHWSKCYSQFHKRAQRQRRNQRTRCWFPFKCHYFCTANEIGTLWEQPSKPLTMSVWVGYWRPCCGQSRSRRQKATCVVLILDTLQIYNGGRCRSAEVRLHSNRLWTLEHHCSNKKRLQWIIEEFYWSLYIHFMPWQVVSFVWIVANKGK